MPVRYRCWRVQLPFAKRVLYLKRYLAENLTVCNCLKSVPLHSWPSSVLLTPIGTSRIRVPDGTDGIDFSRDCTLINCPNCAWRNPQGSRFCENCGADLQVLSRTPSSQQASSWPQPPRSTSAGGSSEDPSSPEWRMAPLPAEEVAPPKRRLWVWLLVAALLACLVLCIASFTVLEYTDTGRNFQTRVAEDQENSSGN